MTSISRRRFVAAGVAVTAAAVLPHRTFAAGSSFKVGVISDEISQDFDHACSVIRNQYGLGYVELRELFGKNLQLLSDERLAEAERILAKYGLTVTDIASPLYKTDWPGAPRSKFAEGADLHGAAATTFAQQDEVLRHSIELAKRFKTDKIRCFDFWRLDDVRPYRKDINAKLAESAEVCARHGMLLVIENEQACNTATGREAAETLAAVPSKAFALNWDPGNAVMAGESDAYPAGFAALPKERIRHCHVKNTVQEKSGKVQWSPVDVGLVDWTAQFKALKEIGYSGAVNLETHWKGGGSPEASSDRSWDGMKKCLIAAGCL